MRAGTLRHRVRIQQLVQTGDGMGGIMETWQDVAVVWAAVEPLQGRELFEAQQVRAELSHRVRLRYRPDIAPKMRLIHKGRVFHIESVINRDERNRELVLLCAEEVT